MSSADSLLWLKYAGLPGYGDIYSKRDFYAFKCKKYAYWKDVHSSAESKDLLLSCFESLKSNEELSLEQYEEIQKIWEKVQRWKKDKEKLSFQPAKTKSFLKLEAECQAGSLNSDFILSYISDIDFDVTADPKEPDIIWLTFLSKVLDNFLCDSSHIPDEVKELDASGCSDFLEYVDQKIVFLYDYLGYSLEGNDVGTAILTILSDFGIAYEKEWVDIDVTKSARPLSTVSILTQDDDLSKFIIFRGSMGNMSVVVNPNHPAFLGSEVFSNRQVRVMIEALGQAALDNIGDIDKIQDYVNTVGSRLRLALKVQKRDEKK
jgi:hypothetical protein